MKKKYELISFFSGIIGMLVFLTGAFSFVYFIKMTTENVESWWWKPFLFIGVSFLLMIPMSIYSKRAFNLEIQEVKTKNPQELECWIEETSKKSGEDYVDSVMRKVGYAQKWVKNA